MTYPSALLDLNGERASPKLIRRVTDAVLDEARERQSFALDSSTHRPFRHATPGDPGCRDSQKIMKKTVCTALSITVNTGVVFGISERVSEGTEFWLLLMSKLKNQGSWQSDRHRRRTPGMLQGNPVSLS